MQAESQKYEKASDQIFAVETELRQYKKQMVETMAMHTEDLAGKMQQVTRKMMQVKQTVDKVNEANAIVQFKVEDTHQNLEELALKTEDLQVNLEDLRKRKLDAVIYDKEVDELQDIVDQLRKRQLFGEDEAREFADFMLRYMPVLFLNQMTEGFNSCLGAQQLEMYMCYQQKRALQMKATLKERMIPANHMRDEKELVMNAFEQLNQSTRLIQKDRATQEKILEVKIEREQEEAREALLAQTKQNLKKAIEDSEKATKSALKKESAKLQE